MYRNPQSASSMARLNQAAAARRIAREKSRIKPEDIQKRHVLYGLGAAIVSFFRRLGRFFFNRGRKYHPVKHASGFFGQQMRNDLAPKWFRHLQARHYGEVGRSTRKVRRWCQTGYWSKPRAEHVKKHSSTVPVESLGKASKAHWRKPKAKV
jgi:hypothetical protein